MKSLKGVLIACAMAVGLGAPFGTAYAEGTGYIRIGDKCYIDIGINTPVLVPFACPNEVSSD